MTTARQSFALSALSPQARRALRVVLIVAAVLGAILGLQTLVLHATSDPLHDLRIYYDAGARLNQGQPLYDAAATDSVGLYLYPPLLAISFRPLALLPFEVVAVAWEVLLVAAVAATVRRAGVREPVLIALGCLALPIGWALAVGQLEPIVTLLVAVASPWTIALAANLKVFPILVAAYWIGRRDVQSLGRLGIGVALLVAIQLLLEPEATIAWLQLTWLTPAFEVRSISAFAVSPLLWLALVAGLTVAALRFSSSRYGWALSVSLAVFAYPRLLVYQLMTLLAAFAGPSTDRDA